jgi:hypothetical protein
MSVPRMDLPPPRPPRSLAQRIVATVGIIIMVLTGGCTLTLIGASMADPYDLIWLYLVIGGVPFLVGALITWLALRRRS